MNAPREPSVSKFQDLRISAHDMHAKQLFLSQLKSHKEDQAAILLDYQQKSENKDKMAELIHKHLRQRQTDRRRTKRAE